MQWFVRYAGGVESVGWHGSLGTEEVNYTVSPDAARTIAVDRQYLDTAEGAHTVDIVNVKSHHHATH